MSAVPHTSPQSGWDRRRTVLLERYERIALELFAERGYRNVTVDDVAVAAGVSARTMFRYFPTKEDFLLGMPRRSTAALTRRIEVLAPSDAPHEAAWHLILGWYSDDPPDVEFMTLWRRAAADAPEVEDRVRGERVQTMLDALTRYIADSFDVDPAGDPRPRILAGTLVGMELAVVEAMTRSTIDMADLMAAAGTVLKVD